MSRTTITSVSAREAFSDRGVAAVMATVKTECGAKGMAVCSAGVSVGTHEVVFAYDGGTKWRGKGVMNAVRHVNEIIAPRLIGLDAANQSLCDSVMLDIGKEMLGGNATAAVSAAVLKAGAAALDMPLYQHIGGARAFTLPVPGAIAVTGSTRYGGPPEAGYKPTYSFMSYDFPTFSEASYALWEVNTDWLELLYRKLGVKMTAGAGNVIPTGKVESDYVLWDMMAETIAKAGYEGKIGLQVDVAADSFYDKESNMYKGLFCSKPKSREDLIELFIDMPKKYPFVILEDPLSEDDFEGHAEITKKTDIQIVGDDLFTTNAERLKKGIKAGAANCILLKVNQIGTISEAAQTIQLAQENNYGIMPCSSRGEGNDICDYAVGFNCGTVRESGLSFPGNRFLQIEKELGARARFFGKKGLRGSRFQIK